MAKQKFNLDDYTTVQKQIDEFYQEYPEGSIRTFLAVHDGPEVAFEARVFRTTEEARDGIYTSGWARKIEGKGYINEGSHLENCESSAVGRALANLGYSTNANRPTRSEMLKVARQREEMEELVDFIHAFGKDVPEDAEYTEGVTFREYVADNWGTIKTRIRDLQDIVTFIEQQIGRTFQSDVEESAA